MTTSTIVEETVSTTLVSDAVMYTRRRSSQRSSVYIRSRLVNAHRPRTPSENRVPSSVARISRDSDSAKTRASAATIVVVTNVKPLAVRARRSRRSASSSSNQNRSSASPIPKRRTMLARMMNVSSVSA